MPHYLAKLNDVQRGQVWVQAGSDAPIIVSRVKVMGIVDGYVVYRYVGRRLVDVKFWKEFVLTHDLVRKTDREGA